MKQLYVTLAAAVFISSSTLASINWDGDTSVNSDGHETWEIANAAKTETPPTIDGIISAGEWDDAERYQLGFTTHSSMDPAGLEAYFKVMWDDDHIYILIEGTDAVGIDSAGHRFELYISTAYTRKFGQWMVPGFEENDYQILSTINPVDTFYELGLYSEQTALASFQRENVIAAGSYVSEVKIAWSDLGGLPSTRGLSNSDYIGFDVHVQRGTANNNRSKLAWAAPVDVAWASTEDWGTLRLLGADGPTPTPIVSFWSDIESDASGFKNTGIGMLMDTHFPHLFHANWGSWISIDTSHSGAASLYAWHHGINAWVWTGEALGGWFYNMSDSESGHSGWHQ